jgi:hypothetical protein
MVENRRIFISHPRSTIPHRTTSNICQASPGTRQLPWYDEQPVTVHHRRLWDQPNTKRDRHSGSGNTPKIVGIWIHSLRLRCGDRRIRIIVEFARASSQCDARLHRNHRGTRPSERKTVRRVQKLSRHILRPIKHHILYTKTTPCQPQTSGNASPKQRASPTHAQASLQYVGNTLAPVALFTPTRMTIMVFSP